MSCQSCERLETAIRKATVEIAKAIRNQDAVLAGAADIEHDESYEDIYFHDRLWKASRTLQQALTQTTDTPDSQCKTCGGSKRVETKCTDPNCGDSTHDHYCGEGYGPCPDCQQKEPCDQCGGSGELVRAGRRDTGPVRCASSAAQAEAECENTTEPCPKCKGDTE